MLLYFLVGVASLGASTSPTNCQKRDGSSAPCGPGNDMCHFPGYGRVSPQYHIVDQSCGMNVSPAPPPDKQTNKQQLAENFLSSSYSSSSCCG